MKEKAKIVEVPVGSFVFPTAAWVMFGLLAVAGAVMFGLAVKIDPARAWPNFLVNYFFFLLLALSGAFFTAVQHITNAYWSVTVRRLAEALISFLPVAAVLAVVLFLGRSYLYEWTHPAVVAQDHLLQLKAPYLNQKFHVIRQIVFFTLWIILAFRMRSNSLKQDGSGEHRFTLRNIKLSAVFLPVFAVTFTLMSFDTIMSLEPTWYSTIFGVYCFSGMFVSGLALLALLAAAGKRLGVLSDVLVNSNHLHDVGKLMLAMTVFWAYIMFSQLMLQWYGNLPEETSYYIKRFYMGWGGYGIVLLGLHFVVPFLALLPRSNKRKGMALVVMAALIMVAQWMDVYYLVMPVFFKVGPVFGWMELGTIFMFAGLFALPIMRFLTKVPAVPKADPRFAECLAHTQ